MCGVKGFAELGMSSESKALRSIFFGQARPHSFPPYLPLSLSLPITVPIFHQLYTELLFPFQTECKKNRFGKPAKRPQKLAVLGAGLMGAGIVQVLMNDKHNFVYLYLSFILYTMCMRVHVHV